MTMRKVPAGGMWVPYPLNFNNAIPQLSDDPVLSVEESSLKVAFTFVCPVSGELDMFEFFLNVSTADPATTLKCSFQDLDSNDFPDGGADFYRIITVADFATLWIQPGLITSDGTDTGTKKTVTRGQKIACVVEFETSHETDLLFLGTIPISYDTVRRSSMGSCYYVGSWTRNTRNMAVATLKYNSFPAYYPIENSIPTNGFNEISMSTGTTPDEVGLKFSLPTPVRIGGASACLSSATGTSWDCVLYDSGNNVVDTVPMKMHTDLFPANGYTYWTARFSSDVFVPGNEEYIVTVKPSSATSVKLLGLSFFDSLILSQTNGYLDTGSGEHYFHHVERTDGGTFTPLAILPLISINVTGIDMDAGGATDDWTGDA